MTIHSFPTRSPDGQRQNWIIVTQYSLADAEFEITDEVIEGVIELLPSIDSYSGVIEGSIRYAFRIDQATIMEANTIARSVSQGVSSFLCLREGFSQDIFLAGDESLGGSKRLNSDTDSLMAVWSFGLRPMSPPTQTLRAVK